jgi:hypothetical protein
MDLLHTVRVRATVDRDHRILMCETQLTESCCFDRLVTILDLCGFT